MASTQGYLDGQILVAMPLASKSTLRGAVIYLIGHSSGGAMGIIVNRPAANLRFPDLLVRLEIIGEGDLIKLPPKASIINVVQGGPVESSRGFMLHTADYFLENSTLPIDDDICLTSTRDVLTAIASGEGPESAVLALGYIAWLPGILENEIRENSWLHCPADPELVFGIDMTRKYPMALHKIGIDIGRLSSQAGHG